MSFPEKIATYLGEKIGEHNVSPFTLWALVGMIKPRKTDETHTFIDRWNMVHPLNPIKVSMNAFDAVDRMIEIWKERFS